MQLIKIFFFLIVGFNLLLAKEYIIKFSYVVSNNTPKGKAALYFKKRVEELSKGKIKVKLYPNAILGSDKVILRKIKFNTVQMAAPSFSKFTSFIPEFGLFDLPYLFKNEKHLHKVLDGEIGKNLMHKVVKKGYIPLAYWDNGFKQFTDSKRALIYPKDFKGLKFRIMSSKVLLEQFKVLGAVPVILPFSEVYSALQQGIVDGEENTISNIYTKNFYKIQNYMTISNHGYLGYLVVIGDKFWKSLPNDLKLDIKKAIKEATIKERIWAKKLNRKQLKKIKEYAKKTKKLKIIYLNFEQKEILAKKLKTIYPKFYDTIGKKLIDEVIKESNPHRRIKN